MFGGIAMIAAFIANHWGKLIVLVVYIALGTYIAILNAQITRLEHRLDEARQELKAWNDAYNIVAAELVKQNEAIKKLDEQRKTALKKRARGDKKAAAIVAHQKEAETRLEAIPSVSEASSTCEAEMDAIKAMLGAAK